MSYAFKEGMVLCQACHFNVFWQNFAYKQYCLNCIESMKRSKPKTPTLKAPQIEAGMLRRLIQLAHPDRHKGSEAATVATQYLLELKTKSNKFNK